MGFMNEPLYTLEQARRIIRRGNCEAFGHSLEKHMATWSGVSRWFCNSCDVVVTFTWPEDGEVKP